MYRRDRNFRAIVGKVWFVVSKEGLRGVKRRIVALSHPDTAPPPVVLPQNYGRWIAQFDSLRESNLPAARRHLATLDLPDMLLMVVVTRTDIGSLDRLAASWRESIHPGWHAALVASADMSGSEVATLTSLAASDPRISVVGTPQAADDVRHRFEYTLLCFGPLLLNAFSIYMFLEAASRTKAEIVYADSDRIDANGRRRDPAFKPQFSPEYLAHENYIGDCLLLSRSVALSSDALFGLTLSDHDRLVETLARGRRVEHVPFILSHVLDDRRRAPHDLPAVENRGPGVAIVIVTHHGVGRLKPCLDSILARTTYDPNLITFVVVDNNSTEAATLAYLDGIARQPNIAVLKCAPLLGCAAMRNVAAREAKADMLVFIDEELVVHDPDWLGKLVRYASRPDVGVVGAKLLSPDGTVAHGGCVAGGNMGTIGRLLANTKPEAADRTREMTLPAAACCAVRREIFQQIGGFDPILAGAWGHAKFALDCLRAGLRNIYIADPLLCRTAPSGSVHDERYFDEADYARRGFRSYFQDDPFYNPNLAVEPARQFAEPPRVRRPWSNLPDRARRILVLSMVYKIGFGVPLVIQQQVAKLKDLGYEVIIGGPKAEKEFAFPGSERVALGSAKEAAILAFERDVALIVVHTAPYFEIPVFIGGHIPVLAYDYGEPSPAFFPEPVRSYLINVANQKRSAAAMTTMIATISQAVKDETLNNDAIVVGLANSHLPAWSEALRPRRDSVRQRIGWGDRFVVLTVCRFSENERAYKGLDKIAMILRHFPYLHPDRSQNLVWALAGAGSATDVAQVEALGFTVFPNVPDETLTDLYAAADAYMGFSRWEGYNLGISQALAMGLPTVASDIPAHREFPIFTSDSTLAVGNWLAREVVAHTAAKHDRRAIVYEWETSTTRFAQIVERIVEQAAAQIPRFGASATPAPEPRERGT
jgi:GT2 family glycosyltransferase